jgi:hypothetical protein
MLIGALRWKTQLHVNMLLRSLSLLSYRFFQRSGLPKEVLARVWDLANSQRAGGQMYQHLVTAYR